MIILGIDPGTATTGYGIIKQNKNQPELVDFGVIATDKKLTDAERLKILADDISDIIAKFKPEAVGIEKIFFTTNQKTIITVTQARGVALYICEKHKIPIYEYTPLQVKNFICGYGKAEKKQVQYMVQKTFNLKKVPKPDDAADALAVAMCAGFFHSKTRHIK